MNLKLHLLTRIALVAVLCLLVLASFLQHKSHQQAEQNSRQLADTVTKQLESQLLLRIAGIGRATAFPDFEFWKQSAHQKGVCLTYIAKDGETPRSICTGIALVDATWPSWFENAYRRTFKPGEAVVRLVTAQGRNYGSLTVTPSAELEIAEAWQQTSSLMALSVVTIFAVCILVYLTISRALKPTQTLVDGLAKLESGQLAYRLPLFELDEWQTIAAAINQLASSQQQLLDERQTLLVKLINLQEQERRLLARELHDEFGQCLAAINAFASSIKQTAQTQAPDLVNDVDHIGRITLHMLAGVRSLLGRLRPAEFDELGLAASLNALIAGWNSSSGGKTFYRLTLTGDCARLSEFQALTLFRITQECLTNIAKHAAATSVSLTLHIDQIMASLTILDDGIAAVLPFAPSDGMGLIGIRERVAALNGQLHLAIAEPHGLIVEVSLPLVSSNT
jgi:signal transduction histidine kinase